MARYSKPEATTLLQFRMAHEAHRDARLVFQAAQEGRPLELQKRLALGKSAGGLSRRCTPRVGVLSEWCDQLSIEPDDHALLTCTPLMVSLLGGHLDCANVLAKHMPVGDAI